MDDLVTISVDQNVSVSSPSGVVSARLNTILENTPSITNLDDFLHETNFVKAIDYKEKLNKKIFNVGMGSEARVIYNDILKNILKYYGISMRYILARIFLDKDYRSPILGDSDDLDNIIHYRNDSLYNYYRRLERIGKKRVIKKL